MTYEEVVQKLRSHLEATAAEHELLDESVVVTARALSPEEAIGNPEHDDYPLTKGRERIMEAVVRGAPGQAFTDMYGRWEGSIRDVCAMAALNNFRRAILVAVLNAVMRYAGEVEGTRHCRDGDPVRCALELKEYVRDEGLKPPFALIGYQPRLAEALADLGELRIADLDAGNIGRERAGVTVSHPDDTPELLEGAGCAFVTGSTVVNGTIAQFLDLGIPTVFFGVTIAGPAVVLGLRRYCALGA
jgi:hypothetical protein